MWYQPFLHCPLHSHIYERERERERTISLETCTNRETRIMENPAEKPKKVEKLTKYGKKLKKMVTFPGKSSDKSTLIPPPHAVRCDELFHSSEGKGGHCRKDIDGNVSPVVAAHITAQNHFSFRPNIYIWEIGTDVVNFLSWGCFWYHVWYRIWVKASGTHNWLKGKNEMELSSWSSSLVPTCS